MVAHAIKIVWWTHRRRGSFLWLGCLSIYPCIQKWRCRYQWIWFDCWIWRSDSYSPTKIVRTIKSITAREIFRRIPSVKKDLWGGEFWTNGYYISSVGKKGNETVIKTYIQEQGKEDEYKQLHQEQLKLFQSSWYSAACRGVVHYLISLREFLLISWPPGQVWLNLVLSTDQLCIERAWISLCFNFEKSRMDIMFVDDG